MRLRREPRVTVLDEPLEDYDATVLVDSAALDGPDERTDADPDDGQRPDARTDAIDELALGDRERREADGVTARAFAGPRVARTVRRRPVVLAVLAGAIVLAGLTVAEFVAEDDSPRRDAARAHGPHGRPHVRRRRAGAADRPAPVARPTRRVERRSSSSRHPTPTPAPAPAAPPRPTRTPPAAPAPEPPTAPPASAPPSSATPPPANGGEFVIGGP